MVLLLSMVVSFFVTFFLRGELLWLNRLFLLNAGTIVLLVALGYSNMEFLDELAVLLDSSSSSSSSSLWGFGFLFFLFIGIINLFLALFPFMRDPAAVGVAIELSWAVVEGNSSSIIFNLAGFSPIIFLLGDEGMTAACLPNKRPL